MLYGTLPVPTRDGYTFVGWWSKASIDETSKEYNSDSIVITETDHTLYAQWAKQYMIVNVGARKVLSLNTYSVSADSGVVVSDISLSKCQYWLVSELSQNTCIKSASAVAFGLNIFSGSTNECNIGCVSGNEHNTLIDIIDMGCCNKIKLHNYNLYLTATSSSNDAAVYWAAPSNSVYQKWDFNEVINV